MSEPYGPVVGEIVLRHVPLLLVDFKNTVQDLFAYPNLGHTHLRKEGGREGGRGKEGGKSETEGEGREGGGRERRREGGKDNGRE